MHFSSTYGVCIRFVLLNSSGEMALYRGDELRKSAETVHGHRGFLRRRATEDHKYQEQMCGRVVGTPFIPSDTLQQDSKPTEVVESLSSRLEQLSYMAIGQFRSSREVVGPVVWRDEKIKTFSARRSAVLRHARQLLSEFLALCKDARMQMDQALDRLTRLGASLGVYEIESSTVSFLQPTKLFLSAFSSS